jgi:O-antigen ligase
MRLPASTLAFYCFVLLFPIDFLSYLLRGSVGVSVPLGLVGILLSLCLLPLLVAVPGRNLLHRLAGLALFAAPIGIVAASDQFDWLEAYFWLRTVLLFALGYHFSIWLAKNPRGSEWLAALWVICAVACVPAREQFADSMSNYLRLGDAFMLLTFVLLAVCRSRGSFWLLLLPSLVVLYIVGSRFSLAVVAVAGASLGILRYGAGGRVVLLMASVPIIVLVVAFSYTRFELLDNVHENRFLRLMFAQDRDTSLQMRLVLAEEALTVFWQNPLLGDYKYYLRYRGDGYYAHNLLSFWAELGILGVLITVVVMGLAVRAVVVSLRDGRIRSSVHGFAYLVAVSVLLGLVFAKSYVWMLIYFSTGCLVAILTSRIAGRDRESPAELPRFAAMAPVDPMAHGAAPAPRGQG